MIQRIQSVYWLLSALVLAVFTFLPLFETAETVFYTTSCRALLMTVIATILILIVNIFLYKKRMTQIRIGYLLIFLHLLMYLFIGAHYYLDAGIKPLPCIGVPVVSIVLQVLAVRGVRKDEELVRSADRLR